MLNQFDPIILTDFYKVGHFDLYPEGTQRVYANFTPRNIKYLKEHCQTDAVREILGTPAEAFDVVVAFGMRQAILLIQQAFRLNFFEAKWSDLETAYTKFYNATLGFCPDLTHIKVLHEEQELPLDFKALPEGTVLSPKVPILTVVNTKDHAYWLPTYIETLLSSSLWKTVTIATIARIYRMIGHVYAEETLEDDGFLNWQFHDFSFRGMSGAADAANSNVGHLLQFMGSDTQPAIVTASRLYNLGEIIPAGSVIATEHSVMCAGGQESEKDTYLRLIKNNPNGILSVVSDTWDIWHVCDYILPSLYNEILARNGQLVIRPDSGDPVEVLCGRKPLDSVPVKERVVGERYRRNADPLSDIVVWAGDDQVHSFFETTTKPEDHGVVALLLKHFGSEVNRKGYMSYRGKKVGAIYGDSITPLRACQILERLSVMGVASDTVVFGVGSYTYNHITRDTIGGAVKATHVVINGEAKDIQKSPVTDPGKKSATGLLRVDQVDGQYVLTDRCTPEQEEGGELVRVGDLLKETRLDKWEDMVERAKFTSYGM